MSLFKKKLGAIITENNATVCVGNTFKPSGNYSFVTSADIKSSDLLMQELKQMVDFIIDNGFSIKTKDFRGGAVWGMAGKAFTDEVEALKDDLIDITIYKNDDINVTHKNIKGKYDSLKKLISIQDGSIFSKESNELFNYIAQKQK